MPYISVQEAALRLAVADGTVRKWLRKGLLKGSKPSNIIRIDEESVAALMAASAITPEARPGASNRKLRPLPVKGGYRHLV